MYIVLYIIHKNCQEGKFVDIYATILPSFSWGYATLVAVVHAS
jgi:hypothetical protein